MPCFARRHLVVADHHLPVGKGLCKHTFDSTVHQWQTSVGRYRNGDKGHLDLPTYATRLSSDSAAAQDHILESAALSDFVHARARFSSLAPVGSRSALPLPLLQSRI